MLALLVCTATAFAAAPSFTDVPANYWAYNYIEQAAENGWVNGVGNGKYDPNGEVTGAEWVTMVMRAFYADDIEPLQSGDRWYQPYMDAANKYDLLRPEVNNYGALERAYSRYEMASLVGNVLVQKGIDVPSIDTSKIGDLSHVPPVYEQAVIDSYSAGILVGNNDAGDFCGDDNMTRAQAAVVLVRMNNVITNGVLPEPEPTPESTPEPEPTPEPENPSANYGPVGTLSDTPVTLSYETHKPVTDYWSSAPADIRAITDQEAYNCAVQTLKDQDMIRDPSVLKDGINPYYNYAVFRGLKMFTPEEEKQVNVTGAVSKMAGYVGFGTLPIEKHSDGTSDKIITATKRVDSEDYDAVINPILARLNDGMSDKEKAEIMVQAICDRFDYSNTNDFSWSDPIGSTGACGSYMHAVNDIFNAAGLPVFSDMGHNHAWNYAYLDGKWYVIDATAVDTGMRDICRDPDEYFSFEWGTSFASEQSDTDKVAMALIESAFA